MQRTLTLRKKGPSFIETVETDGVPLLTKRGYLKWDQVDQRLRQMGVEPEEILRLKSAFDSEADAALIRLPYHRGDAISTI